MSTRSVEIRHFSLIFATFAVSFSASIDFGLMLQPFPLHFSATELFDYNRRLIRTLSPGFTTLWAEDHLQLGETATHECLTTLSYFAGEFPRFRVGALVLSQSYRNPALAAKMAAILQLLSGGRFILGLGAGWKEDEYHAYGYPFPDMKTRLEELEEAAIIVKIMWSARPATFNSPLSNRSPQRAVAWQVHEILPELCSRSCRYKSNRT